MLTRIARSPWSEAKAPAGHDAQTLASDEAKMGSSMGHTYLSSSEPQKASEFGGKGSAYDRTGKILVQGAGIQFWGSLSKTGGILGGF